MSRSTATASNNSLSPLTEVLTDIFSKAFADYCGNSALGKVFVSQRPDLSQYQCNGALAAAKAFKKNPSEIAANIVSQMKGKQMFAALTIDGPGFININLSDEFLAARATAIYKCDPTKLCPALSRKTTIIDFGGPNVAKPMHVGHLRSALIGDCLQRLFRLLGNTVKSDIHLGDWGTPMGMLIMEVKRRNPDLPYFDNSFTGHYPNDSPITIEDLEEMYPQSVSRCKSDKLEMDGALKATAELQSGRPGYRALWKHFVDISIACLKDNFSELDISFDLWLGESNYHQHIPVLLERLKQSGYAVISDNALVIPLDNAVNGSEIPPLILVKSDGAYLYGTTDFATIEERIADFQAEQILYVVDKRQSLHFQQVFSAAKKTGIAGQQVDLQHIAFGTVNSPDGRPFKTRAGGVMKLKDLILLAKEESLKKMEELGVAQNYDEAERLDIANKVGIAALKFGDLMHERTTNYIFDIEKFTRFEGKTGPYVLYAAVRIKSILKKADDLGFEKGKIALSTGAERELLLELCRFPDVLYTACINKLPSNLCDFAFNLAQVFNRFYLQCHILSEENPQIRSSWLALLESCLWELETVMNLLGISIPERM